jgi:2-dehydro-3-deoxygluconokinase
VAVSLSLMGTPSRFLTAIPKNVLGEAVRTQLRGLGVDTSRMLFRKEGRLGIYFLETGANQRASQVTYDRAGSAVSLAGPAEYDMDAALAGVDWVHVTGITPAISEQAFKSSMELLRRASAKKTRVSCDLNFRKKLWLWRPGTGSVDLARECMGELLKYVDVVIGNEEDAESVLGISAEGTCVEAGRINASAYSDVARSIVKRHSNVSLVAITLRESISATHNNWGGMLHDAASGKTHFAPTDASGAYAPYEIRSIVDRVGGGDSFAAGLIHALGSASLSDPATALRFAVAASCLKHSVQGDFNIVSEAEVKALMGGDVSGRVKR